MSKTPVLFLIFTRLDTTRQVFEQIRQAKPTQLFIAADGPRASKEGEKEKCERVRQMVLDGIDWECEVHTLFRDENLGCGVAPATAIDWFFEQVEQGIILEDDCVPDPSFFSFCENLLDYYKNNEQVMHISGSNFQSGKTYGNASYYFSRYSHMWGWATWRRAWQKFDYQINGLEAFKSSGKIVHLFPQEDEQQYWLRMFEMVYNGQRPDIWDYQWSFAIFNAGGFCVTPNVNLVMNIGTGEGATHTLQADLQSTHMPVGAITEITYTGEIKIYTKAENTVFRKYYHTPVSFVNRVRNLMYKYISPETIQSIKQKVQAPR